MSCPSRGTWIEIAAAAVVCRVVRRRAPRGARGLKFKLPPALAGSSCRAPRGARGLKSAPATLCSRPEWSCPSRGTWIEIIGGWRTASSPVRSCPSRGTWIEIPPPRRRRTDVLSCPSRGTWIEITMSATGAAADGSRAPRGARGLKFLVYVFSHLAFLVVPLAGHVD